MRTVTRKKVLDSLLEQIEKKGGYEDHYMSLIDTYMKCWDDVKKLEKDIKDRGVTVEYQHGVNQFGIKKNESIGEKLKVIAQMIKILEALDIKPVGKGRADSGL